MFPFSLSLCLYLSLCIVDELALALLDMFVCFVMFACFGCYQVGMQGGDSHKQICEYRLERVKASARCFLYQFIHPEQPF